MIKKTSIFASILVVLLASACGTTKTAPELSQVGTFAPEHAINTPAQVDRLQAEHAQK